jgi:hypothetical protein
MLFSAPGEDLKRSKLANLANISGTGHDRQIFTRLGRDALKRSPTGVRLIPQSMERSVPYKMRPSLRATDREARLSHEVL